MWVSFQTRGLIWRTIGGNCSEQKWHLSYSNGSQLQSKWCKTRRRNRIMECIADRYYGLASDKHGSREHRFDLTMRKCVLIAEAFTWQSFLSFFPLRRNYLQPHPIINCDGWYCSGCRQSEKRPSEIELFRVLTFYKPTVQLTSHIPCFLPASWWLLMNNIPLWIYLLHHNT